MQRGMDDYRSLNRAWWDELVPHHLASPFYKADAFRHGENVLDPIARERLAGVKGTRLLHLQCHFGLDTLSIALMGANVTGIDFSSPAIATARALAKETGLSGNFVEADVLNPPSDLLTSTLSLRRGVRSTGLVISTAGCARLPER